MIAKETTKSELDQLGSHLMNNYDIEFNKPVFDIAFIITHESLMLKIDKIQSYFQSVHKFSTHAIYVQDKSQIPSCITNLKSLDIYYAIVVNEKSEIENKYDLYVLHQDKVQTDITFEKSNSLIFSDFINMMKKIKILKGNSLKYPHKPKDSHVLPMNEDLRYYFCLLSDCRMLKVEELLQVQHYLLETREMLENKTKGNSNLFNERIFETCHEENLKYYIYEPVRNTFLNPETVIENSNYISGSIADRNESIQPSKFVFKARNESLSDVHNKNSSQEHFVNEQSQFSTYGVKVNSTTQSKSHHTAYSTTQSTVHHTAYSAAYSSVHSTPLSTHHSRTNDTPHSNPHSTSYSADNSSAHPMDHSAAHSTSHSTSYSKSHSIGHSTTYFKTKSTPHSTTHASSHSKTHSTGHSSTHCTSHSKSSKEKDCQLVSYQKLQSQKSKQTTPVTIENFIDLTDDSDDKIIKISTHSLKRKATDIPSDTAKHPKENHINHSSLVTKDVKSKSDHLKSSAKDLICLFRVICNLVPIGLPNDNAIYKILSHSLTALKDGISEKEMKTDQIDYEACKSKGASYIIDTIHFIYDKPVKSLKSISFMVFIWEKYFPKKLDNFNLLILFYRFIKLLESFTKYNKLSVTANFINSIIEKIDTIVQCDIKAQLSENRPIDFSPDTFNKFFKEHDQLHKLYMKLSTSKSLGSADRNKKLDATIKKKKVEFTISQLLNYFVLSINSIHKKMRPEQFEIIYGAIRTLRYCFRNLNPKLVQSKFSKPRLSDFNAAKHQTLFDEMLKELQCLLSEMKSYQCILFTDKHYEFVNCVLDFSWFVEGTLDLSSQSSAGKKQTEPLIILDPVQFINSFVSYECHNVLQYHPKSELEFLKETLKERWISILHDAFTGKIPEPCGSRIVKEMNNLLPNLWGIWTFDEAVAESAKLYYSNYESLAKSNPSGWYKTFSQVRNCGGVWLAKFNLPITNLAVLKNYQLLLDKKFKLKF